MVYCHPEQAEQLQSLLWEGLAACFKQELPINASHTPWITEVEVEFGR